MKFIIKTHNFHFPDINQDSWQLNDFVGIVVNDFYAGTLEIDGLKLLF